MPVRPRNTLCLLALWAATTAHSLTAASDAEFLLMDIHPESQALAGALGAEQASFHGLRNNPASLAGLIGPQVAAARQDSLGEWQHHGAWLAFPWGQSAMGLELLVSQIGPFESYDASGAAAGPIDAGSMILGLGLAHGWAKGKLSVGLGLRIFQSNLAEYKNWGYASDLGILWKTLARLNFALTIKDFGEQTAYVSIRDETPLHARIGLSLGLGGDADKPRAHFRAETRHYGDPSRAMAAHMGLDFTIIEHLKVLVGLWVSPFAMGSSLGASFESHWGTFSYSFSPHFDLGPTHSLGLSWKFQK